MFILNGHNDEKHKHRGDKETGKKLQTTITSDSIMRLTTQNQTTLVMEDRKVSL